MRTAPTISATGAALALEDILQNLRAAAVAIAENSARAALILEATRTSSAALAFRTREDTASAAVEELNTNLAEHIWRMGQGKEE